MKCLVLIAALLTLSGIAQAEPLVIDERCMNWGGDMPCPYGNPVENTESCGFVNRESVLSSSEFTLSKYNSSTQKYDDQKWTATTPEARQFISVIRVYGAMLCRDLYPAEAPFKICLRGDSQSRSAVKITCGQNTECEGPACGGNGFSVNSGSGI